MGTAVVMDLLASGGIAAALWQHFVAAASASCNLTLADRIINGLGVDGAMPEVFAPRASCADSAVTMFGVPYEFWSLAAFAMLGGLAVLVILGRPRAD
jgi:protein dithiol:quinone oxidoreductase